MTAWFHELWFSGPAPDDAAYDQLLERAGELGFNFEGGASTSDPAHDTTVLKLERAEAERDHWKANHDEQVRRKQKLERVLEVTRGNVMATLNGLEEIAA